MDIRPASPNDADVIAEIHVNAWKAAYRGLVPEGHLNTLSVSKRRDYWVGAIASGRPRVCVADMRNIVAGWIAFDECRDADRPTTGEIWAIYVAPDHLGRGIGRELLAHACAELRRRGFLAVTLWVLAQNHRACQFYAKAGFEPEPESSKTVEIGGIQFEEVRYARSIAA